MNDEVLNHRYYLQAPDEYHVHAESKIEFHPKAVLANLMSQFQELYHLKDDSTSIEFVDFYFYCI